MNLLGDYNNDELIQGSRDSWLSKTKYSLPCGPQLGTTTLLDLKKVLTTNPSSVLGGII